MPNRLDIVAAIIEEETGRFVGEETLANALRCAAWFALDEYPDLKAAEFGDAAASCELHRQGAINRFNEAKANLAAALA